MCELKKEENKEDAYVVPTRSNHSRQVSDIMHAHDLPFVLLSSSRAMLIREDGDRKKADSRADIRKSQVFATLFTQGLCTTCVLNNVISVKTSQLTTQRKPLPIFVVIRNDVIVVNPSFASWNKSVGHSVGQF